MKKYLIFVVLLSSLNFFISCNNSSNPEMAKVTEQEHDDEHETPNTATLTEEQIKSIGIELGTIEQKQLTASLKTNGVLKVPNQNKASVNSVYSGVIKSLLVQPGNFVKKGQTIATLANPDFIQAQSEYLNVSSKISLAEMEVKRQKELNEGNAGALKKSSISRNNTENFKNHKVNIGTTNTIDGYKSGQAHQW
jgi:multidrug efflux pump subunit AcrA (membrane-fusion protein)